MKKQIVLQTLGALTLFLVFSGFLASCAPYEPSVHGISLYDDDDPPNLVETLNLAADEEKKLTVEMVIPSSVTGVLTWSSSDENVATVTKVERLVEKFNEEDGVMELVSEPLWDKTGDEPSTVKVSSKTPSVIITVKADASSSSGSTTTITFTAEPGGLAATCEVTVT